MSSSSSSKGNQSPSILLFLAHGTEEIEFSTCYDVFVRAGFRVTCVFVGTSSTPSPSSEEDKEKASEEQSTSASASGGGGGGGGGGGSGGDVHRVPFAKLSRGLKVIPDLALSDLSSSNPSTDATSFSAIVVPGGAIGAETISNNESIQKLIAKYYADGKVVAAICAGSLAVKRSGIGQDSQVTSHPSVKGEFEKDYRYSEERVVVADNIITSRGPGTSILFALTIVEKLAGKDKRDEVAGPMILSKEL